MIHDFLWKEEEYFIRTEIFHMHDIIGSSIGKFFIKIYSILMEWFICPLLIFKIFCWKPNVALDCSIIPLYHFVFFNFVNITLFTLSFRLCFEITMLPIAEIWICAGQFSKSETFFRMSVMRHCNRLSRKVVDVPLLEVFKLRLDGALSNLI